MLNNSLKLVINRAVKKYDLACSPGYEIQAVLSCGSSSTIWCEIYRLIISNKQDKVTLKTLSFHLPPLMSFWRTVCRGLSCGDTDVSVPMEQTYK